MHSLTFDEILLRLLAAFGSGLIFGWERSSRGRPAGLRTTILACVAAAAAMIVSEKLFVESGAMVLTGNWRPDPARLGAGILTGIGFLGAGTIMRHENIIRGVTTAACLWFVTVVGLALGSGEFEIGGAVMVIGLISIFLLPRLEKYIESDRYVTLSVTESLDGLGEDELRKRVEAVGAHIKSIRLNYDFEKKRKTIVFDIRLKKPLLYGACRQMLAELANCPGVAQASWE